MAPRILFCAALVAASLGAQAIRTNPGFSKQSIPRNDDGSSEGTPLGFTINFFGKIRDSVWVNNNGNLTFDSPLATFTPFGLQKTSREIIAPFFADVDTRNPKSALVTYGQDKINGRNAFAANFIDVGYYDQHADKLNRFQVVLIDRSDTGPGNFNIEFNYERISWETGDASGGVNGFGGVPATVGWSNGSTDPGTSFELPGSMQSGAFLDGGPRSLVRTHLNTSQPARFVFQARDGMISPGPTLNGGPVLPDGTVGDAYSYAFSVSGVDGSAKWDLVPDLTMPAGLQFANGKITGVPTTTGTYTFTVSASADVEGEQVTVYSRATLTIGVRKLTIRTVCPVPAGTVGQLYSTSFQTLRPGEAVWSVDDRNTLPPGLTLSAAGQLSGMPSAPGTYGFLLRAAATDGSAQPAEKSCVVTIDPATVRLTNGCTMPGATAGVPYSQTLIPEGGVGPYRFTLMGQLPLGLGLAQDGRISGLPQFAENGSFDVEIKDSRSNTVRQSCTLAVSAPTVSIGVTSPLPSATTGSAYGAALDASGGSGPYTWSVAGTLPPGLTLGSDQIAGIPMAAGNYSFRLIATDATGNQTGSACSLPVRYGPLAVSGCPLPEAMEGDSYRASLTPAGGSQPFTWSMAGGALPPGLQLTNEGVVAGKVTKAGDYQFSIALGDRFTPAVTQPCTMRVKPLALRVLNIGAAPSGSIGQPYSMRFSAAGGTAPYRFQFAGYLPEGLTGSSDGMVSGTPSRTGTTSFGIKVTDARGETAEAASSIEIKVPAVPAVRFSTLPATVAQASTDVKIGIELDRAYTLPISGQLVLSLQADTQNLTANANQPDPHVRFLNGQLTTPFQIPAGALRVDVPLSSTGTVATTMTVSVRGLRAGGADVTAPVTPQVFRVRATPPVLTSACYTKSPLGIRITALGSSSTRDLLRGEVGAAQIVRSTDLTEASSDYFSSDGTIRFGGAFTLQFDADAVFKDSTGPFTIRVSNGMGYSASMSAQQCR